MKHALTIIALILAQLCITNIAFCASDNSLPKGWRLPIIDDYPENLLALHDNILPIEVIADFNGDGQQDKANYLINDHENKENLFIFWSFGTKNQKIDRLADNDFNSETHFGISLLKPGTHKTACGIGYYECKPGEPKEIELSYPGIGYFMIGSAFSVFYWDGKNKKPNHVWLSD